MFWVTTSAADSSLVTGQQYGYAFDTIGNRITKTFNGQTESYTANLLNQYSSRTLPGFIWETGSANSNATVTVNNLATTRKGMYFAGTVPVNNNASTIYTQLLTVGVLKNAGTNSLNIVAVSTGKVFVAQSPEPFNYDLDGNLTADGRWSYTWDAENRLISMVTQASLPASVPRVKLLFAYDYQNRRVSKVVSNYTGGVWVATSNLKFVYDGWNLLAELNQTNAVLRSYAWGLDLSGSQQGAGGIGGLLWTCQTGSSTNFVAYDGNGNVTTLLDTTTSTITAQYEYGPFGELIRASGTAAANNPFRFSTHYFDQETGLIYAKNRYYKPSTGSWINRDPSEEQGGLSLYGYVNGDPVGGVDPYGDKDYPIGLGSTTVVVNDKNYPQTDSSDNTNEKSSPTLTNCKVCSWNSTGKANIVFTSADQKQVKFVPTAESGKGYDSSIIATDTNGDTHTLKIYFARPKWAMRPTADQLSKNAAINHQQNTYWVATIFNWAILDQNGFGLAFATVTETVDGGALPGAGGKTDVHGILMKTDTYGSRLNPGDGYPQGQVLHIGNWAASTPWTVKLIDKTTVTYTGDNKFEFK